MAKHPVEAGKSPEMQQAFETKDRTNDERMLGTGERPEI